MASSTRSRFLSSAISAGREGLLISSLAGALRRNQGFWGERTRILHRVAKALTSKLRNLCARPTLAKATGIGDKVPNRRGKEMRVNLHRRERFMRRLLIVVLCGTAAGP